MVSVLETILQKAFCICHCNEVRRAGRQTQNHGQMKKEPTSVVKSTLIGPFFALPALVGSPSLESIFCLASRPNGTTEQRICLSYYSTLQQIL